MFNEKAVRSSIVIERDENSIKIKSPFITLSTKLELGTTFLNEDILKLITTLSMIYLKNGRDKTKQLIDELNKAEIL